MSAEWFGAVVGAVGVLSGFFIGKRKRTADARKTELDAVDQAVKIWRELAQDLKKEVEDLREQVTRLQAENEELHNEVERLKEMINE